MLDPLRLDWGVRVQQYIIGILDFQAVVRGASVLASMTPAFQFH